MKLILSNVNACVFGVGFLAAVRGVALWSPAAGWVAFGVVLMAIGVWPFLRVRKS